VTEPVAADSNDTDFRIGPTLCFHVPAVFDEEMRRHYSSWTGNFASCSIVPLGLAFLEKVDGDFVSGVLEKLLFTAKSRRCLLPHRIITRRRILRGGAIAAARAIF